jgi:hypothetical protein
MKKGLFLLVLAIIIAGGVFAETMIVNADTLNVRSGPSADTSLVGQVARGTRVEVLDNSGQWYRIRAGNITGYVNSSYLAADGSSGGGGGGGSSGGSSSRSSSSSSSGVKNYISGEISIFGGGLRYDRMLSPQMSIGVNAYYNTWIFWDDDFGVDGIFRFYPMGGNNSIAAGFYFGGGIGFHMHWGDWGGLGYWSYLLDDYSWGYLIGGAITPDVGWRIDFGDPGGFFIEPGVRFPFTLGARKKWDYDLYSGSFYKWKFDWDFTVIAYVGFGFAF